MQWVTPNPNPTLSRVWVKVTTIIITLTLKRGGARLGWERVRGGIRVRASWWGKVRARVRARDGIRVKGLEKVRVGLGLGVGRVKAGKSLGWE